MKETGKQIAALPLRTNRTGRLQVLMVTSRDTGRWVLPKGWAMCGKTPWAAAGIEAMEEAGAEGRIATDPIGDYYYDKVLDDGSRVLCRVRVYPMLVEALRRTWKEKSERERRWFALKTAAERVYETELKRLLLDLEAMPSIPALFKDLRKA